MILYIICILHFITGTYIYMQIVCYFCNSICILASNMASSGLKENAILTKLYLPWMAPVNLWPEEGTGPWCSHWFSHQLPHCQPAYGRVWIKTISSASNQPRYGLGRWMTPLSHSRQNIANSSSSTITPLTLTCNIPWKIPRAIVSYPSWPL